MRIYCAVTRTELELFKNQGGIESEVVSALTMFAQTPQWVAVQEESDPEVLDDEILQQCAAAGDVPGFVIVAEVTDQQITDLNPGQGLVQASSPIRLKDVAAFFQVAQIGELSWFGPTELPVLLDLGQ